MKLYRRNSIYRLRALRRLRYGRGNGVHSPLAFATIQSIVSPVGSYYIEELRRWTEDELLLFRLVARFHPNVVYIIGDYDRMNILATLARSDVLISDELETIDENSVLVTDDCDAVTIFRQASDGAVLLTGIRKSRTKEQAFVELVGQIQEGIIIDLFHTALLIDIPEIKYIYRSTT